MKQIFTAFLLALGFVASSSGNDWIIRRDGRALTKVVWTGVRYVAIGHSSTLLTSEDGLNWTSHTGVLANRTMVDIAWSGRTLLAVSAAGDIASSANGIDWLVTTAHSLMSARSLFWTGSTFLLFTTRADSVYSISEQGVWKTHATGAPAIHLARKVFWDGQQAVMRWTDGVGDTTSISSDGRNWTKRPVSRIRNPVSLIRLDSIYLGCIKDTLMESRDLVSWSPRGQMLDPLGKRFFAPALIHAYGRFWSYNEDGNRPIMSSQDGIRWEIDSSIVGFLLNQSMCKTDKDLFLLGDNGVILGKVDSASPWTLRRLGMRSDLQGVIWNGANFVAMGSYQSHLESSDGKTWAVLDGQGFDSLHGPDGCAALIWSGTTKVCVNPNGGRQSVSDTSKYITKSFVDGYWGEDRFHLVGKRGALASSLDGIRWVEDSLPWKADLSGGIRANGLHVVVGDTIIASSPDGRTWSRHTTQEKPQLLSVAWGNGTWIGVGISKIHTSKDAASWSPLSISYPTPLRAVRFLDGRFVAVGNNGLVMTSTDGSEWVSENVGADVQLDDVTSSGKGLVAVGQFGTIFTYGDPLIPTTSFRSNSTRELIEPVVRGNTLVVPPWVREVGFFSLDGSRYSISRAVDGELELDALPAGVWIARCRGKDRLSSLRILR